MCWLHLDGFGSWVVFDFTICYDICANNKNFLYSLSVRLEIIFPCADLLKVIIQFAR